MGKLLSILVLVLMMVLFVPTGLVLASQDALPGDLAYPLKRKLESITLQLAALNPKTAAIFSADLSKRRFNEAAALLNKGKDADETLVELIAQTQQAAGVIDQVKDEAVKKQLVADLSLKIENYSQGLSKIEETKKTAAANQTIESPSPPPRVIQPATSPLPTIQPVTTPVPSTTENDSEKMTGLVKADAARRRNTDISQVELISVKEVGWSSSCLGIIKPKQFCLTVITPGFIIELKIKGETLFYHTSHINFVLVSPEEPTPSVVLQPSVTPKTEPVTPKPVQTLIPTPSSTISPEIGLQPKSVTTINQLQTTIHELDKIKHELEKTNNIRLFQAGQEAPQRKLNLAPKTSKSTER